jgi:hypothetical protein
VLRGHSTQVKVVIVNSLARPNPALALVFSIRTEPSLLPGSRNLHAESLFAFNWWSRVRLALRGRPDGNHKLPLRNHGSGCCSEEARPIVLVPRENHYSTQDGSCRAGALLPQHGGALSGVTFLLIQISPSDPSPCCSVESCTTPLRGVRWSNGRACPRLLRAANFNRSVARAGSNGETCSFVPRSFTAVALPVPLLRHAGSFVACTPEQRLAPRPLAGSGTVSARCLAAMPRLIIGAIRGLFVY